MNFSKNKANKQSIYKQDFSWPDDAPVWPEESEELTNNLDELRERSKE